MPTQVFETGAIFVLEDRFSEPLAKLLSGLGDVESTLKKITEQTSIFGGAFNKATKSAIDSLGMLNADFMEKSKVWSGAMDSVFAGLGKSAEGGSNSAIAALDRLDLKINTTMGRIGAMSSEMEKMGAAAGNSAIGGISRHIRPGGHGKSGYAHRLEQIESGGHTAILGSLGIAGAAIYEAASVDDVIARAMITGQLPVGQGYMQSDAAKQMRGTMQKIMSASGYSAHDVGEALLGTERQFGGLPFGERMDLLGQLAPLAASESKLKDTGFKESFQSLIGLMHMTGTFKKEDLPEMARAFTFASLNTPQSLEQFERTLGYSMPVLKAGLGMDPAAIMFMTAMEQVAGVSSTKAGTWTRDLFKNSMPYVGDQLTDNQKKHNDDLKRLGLLDTQGHLTWQDHGADGKIDWMQSIIHMSQLPQTNLPKIDPVERMRVLSGAFGERGGGAAALMNLPQFVEQLPILADRMKSFQGGSNALSELSNSTAQKARQSWQDTMVIVQDIGEKLLPTVNTGLKDFGDILKGVSDVVGGKGWGNLLKQLYENGIKPDLGPLPSILGHGDPANRPPTMEERSRMLNPGIHKSAFEEIFGGGRDGPFSDAIAGGFLKAFREIQGGGINVPDVAVSGGFVNAAYFGTGGTGSASGGGTGASSGGGTFSAVAPGNAVDAALKLQGLGSRGAAAALGAHMTNGEWCADFVNGALEANGIKGSGSSAALSFSHWGRAVGVSSAMKGDVAFEAHGGGHGHAMLITGEHDARGWLGVVAGNSGGQVKRYWENPAKIAGVRRAMPTAGPPPVANAPIVIHHKSVLDGKIVAQNTTYHQGMMTMFPTEVGTMDTHGYFASPGTPLTDAA